MSDVIVTETLSDAIFTDSVGDVITLSGTWTTYYDPATGAIENGNHQNGTRDSILDFTATGALGTTTFSSAYAPYNTPITDANGVSDGYELKENAASNNIYQSLYFDYLTQMPAALVGTLSGGLHSSIKDDLGNTYTLTSGGVVTCFMPGTLISVETGAVAVETLRIGDLVALDTGGLAPIRWIGRQTVNTRFADRLRVLPVRVRAGALGDNLPLRDLLLSPGHALLVDNTLIQAGALVNGISIVRETKVPEIFTYYHVELADHSLILAEGVAAETFIDNADRMGFDNWAEHDGFGDIAPMVELAYPRAKAQRQVPRAIRNRLAGRASLNQSYKHAA